MQRFVSYPFTLRRGLNQEHEPCARTGITAVQHNVSNRSVLSSTISSIDEFAALSCWQRLDGLADSLLSNA